MCPAHRNLLPLITLTIQLPNFTVVVYSLNTLKQNLNLELSQNLIKKLFLVELTEHLFECKMV